VRAVASKFGSRLAAIVVAALAIRLLYALVVMADDPVTGDGREFHLLARVLAEQERYLQPFQFLFRDEIVPTAEKPVLYPLLVALPGELGLSSYTVQHVLDCLLGAATVLLVGLLGRRVGSEHVGLLAAGIATLYPMLIVLSGAARSEALYAALVALALLLAYRLLDRPSAGRALGLGAALGLATLTRSEALLLLVLLALPLVALLPRGRRLAPAGFVALGCALLVLPWVARNWIVFDRPALSTNEGGLLAGANCDAAYHGSLIGTWPCFPRVPRSWGTNEAEISARLRRRALDYAGDHAGRLPLVAAVRALRTWELYQPRAQALLEHRIADRDLRLQQAGIPALYLLAVLALYGGVVLRRRGRPLRVLVAPLVLVTLVAALTYGSSRFRAAADVPLTVLAAVGLAALLRRRREPAEAVAA